ncbi:hypothetical protein CR513_10224, partial [Mucuna pruriens]
MVGLGLGLGPNSSKLSRTHSKLKTKSIIEYYGTLNSGLFEKGRIFKFLHGLNFEYDPIRVQILGKEKLPSLFEIFFIVRSEET